MVVFGGCSQVEVGMEADLLFDEGWQFLVVLLSCVWGVWITLTIFVLFILLSKLVFGCAVLCENCECIDGKELGNVWRDKYLFVEMCRSWVVLIVLDVFCRKGGDKLFLGKALYFFLALLNRWLIMYLYCWN